MSSVLTNYGTWQPSLATHRGPTVLEALLGGLGGQGPARVRDLVSAGPCSCARLPLLLSLPSAAWWQGA